MLKKIKSLVWGETIDWLVQEISDVEGWNSMSRMAVSMKWLTRTIGGEIEKEGWKEELRLDSSLSCCSQAQTQAANQSSSVLHKITRVTSQFNTWDSHMQHSAHICCTVWQRKEQRVIVEPVIKYYLCNGQRNRQTEFCTFSLRLKAFALWLN